MATKLETIIVLSIVGMVALAVAGVAANTIAENKSKDVSAHVAGFTNFAEMDAASKKGITDPIIWRTKVAVDEQLRAIAEKERVAKIEKAAAEASPQRTKDMMERIERERPATERMSPFRAVLGNQRVRIDRADDHDHREQERI